MMGTGEGGHNVDDQGGWQGAEGWVVLTVPLLLHDYSQLQAAPGVPFTLFHARGVWTSGGLGTIRLNFQPDRGRSGKEV